MINSKNTNTIILSAGRGSRLRYKTNFIAKPLVKIQKKVILETNLKYLSSIGIKSCVINSSYKYKTIKKFINNYSYKNKLPNIKSTYEKTRLETGGGIKNALAFFDSKYILAINGDSLLIKKNNICPVTTLLKYFNPNEMDILLLLCPKKNCVGHHGKGDFSKHSKNHTSLIKRNVSLNNNALVFTGWQIIKKSLIKETSLKKFSLNILFDKAERENKLYGTILNGNFLHVSTLKSIVLIEKFLNKFNRKI